MSFSWKVLLPFAIVQVLANGIIMAYGGPDWVVGLVSFALLLALFGLVFALTRTRKAGTRRAPFRPRPRDRG